MRQHVTVFLENPRRALDITIQEKDLQRILSSTIFDFLVIGGFLCVSFVYIYSNGLNMSTQAMLLLLGLVIVAHWLFKTWQTRRLLANAREGSRDIRWLLSRITYVWLALFTLTGAILAAAILLIGIGLNDFFKSMLGAVPSVTVSGHKFYITSVSAILLLIAGVWGCKTGAKNWAGRQVRARKANA
jgi:hypothetical protein